MSTCEEALKALKAGSFVLVYDAEGREGETDMMIAAEFITPRRVYELRSIAGGLICVALSFDVAERLGLPLMTTILEAASSQYPILSKLAPNDVPYGDRPAFSITVNHRKTFTGITDEDRALTIKELAGFALRAMRSSEDINTLRGEFGASFRSPGHVHLLIAAKDLLRERRGHTELSISLAEMAGLAHAVVICEMLDGRTGSRLKKDKAVKYAKKFSLPFIEGEEVVKPYFRFKEGRGHG
ncbi:MAG: 3,4-dihydroxy-2-butanone-4-phosphate synthase [Candidatus Nezhaarchaeota archaeon]|nr:3,4-dihydroxy-2-butanone-4-phosphate synthase [Candidatus Nezhaarchaeota archaeon]